MKGQNFNNESGINGKLRTYLALTAGFVALSPLADAQIIYTDVNPDSVLTGNESFQLDINKDGTFDYTIKEGSFIYKSTKYYGNSFTGLNGNQVFSFGFGTAGSSWGYAPAPLNFGDTMLANKQYRKWGNGGKLFINYSNWFMIKGLWKGKQDTYLGFRFKISGDFHYGWARLDVDSSGKFIILKDYAYNDEAGKKIMAGSSKVSLPDDNPMKNIRVYSSGNNIRIEAPVDQSLTGRIRLSDINGRELRSVDVKNEKNIQLNTQLLPGGVYIVNIITEKGTLNKKVLIR